MTRKSSRDKTRRPVRFKRRLALLLGSFLVVATCITIRYYWPAASADAQYPRRPAARRGSSTTAARPAKPDTTPAKPKIVALVNGEEITREELARECLWHYGTEVLETMVNKHLIVQECARFKIAVTREDVDAEITRMATRFGLSVDQWLKMLKEERGADPARYANDIIWPTLALRKLAGAQLTVTPEEVQRELETRFGEAVQVRLIMCQKRQKAEQVHAKAVANPASFGKLAKQYSEDVNSAAAEGLIQPIRQHVGYKEIEDAAFGLEDGRISPIVDVGQQYIILKRERLIAARRFDEDEIKPRIEEAIRDKKLRSVATEIFQKLQEDAKLDVVFNDPAKRKRMPGVAATINGQPIPLAELAEECMVRHGKDVLTGTINRKLLAQACKKRNITITEQDLDAEIEQAAALSVPSKKDGKPDVEAYLKLVVEKQNITVPIFRRDAAWPAVALKKLVGPVKVPPEDLERGFEANYGPRVQCRAIVVNDQRRAFNVWEKARANLNPESFGRLAKEYSIDATSGSMGGQIPPIKRWCGRPILEEHAFKLKPGELSGVFSSQGKYVILYCEKYTKPLQVTRKEVETDLRADIIEKKRQMAMGKYFQSLRDSAAMDNYLTGTVHTPKRRDAAVRPAAASLPNVRRVPIR